MARRQRVGGSERMVCIVAAFLATAIRAAKPRNSLTPAGPLDRDLPNQAPLAVRGILGLTVLTGLAGAEVAPATMGRLLLVGCLGVVVVHQDSHRDLEGRAEMVVCCASVIGKPIER